MYVYIYIYIHKIVYPTATLQDSCCGEPDYGHFSY